MSFVLLNADVTPATAHVCPKWWSQPAASYIPFINISNLKQTISFLHLFSKIGWHLWAAALPNRINQTGANFQRKKKKKVCGEGSGWGLHLETLVWLRGSTFSDRSGLNQHFQPVGDGWKAGDARSGQTAISQLGVRRIRHVGAKLVIMLQNGKQLISLNAIHQ